MKITCKAEIVSRDAHCHLKDKKRSLLSTLALCKKPSSKANSEPSDKDVFLMIVTNQNPKGTKYKVYNNVETMFTRFINEGKATMRIKKPHHDIILSKADPLQLKGFLHGIALILVGQGCKKMSFSPLPTKVEPLMNKLSICEQRHYPTRSIFPTSLTWLQVTNCRISKVDEQILKLYNLQVLNLSENMITVLPPTLGQLRLRELILKHNQIEEFPVALSTGALGLSLQVLNLAFNKLLALSPYFSLMKNIRVLSLQCNKLSALPRNIQCLESLRNFNICGNNLKVLPFGITKLHLDTLDLFRNPLDTKVEVQPQVAWQVNDLLELSARSLVSNKICYGPQDIPVQLNDFIVKRCPCHCGNPVFQQKSSNIMMANHNKLATTIMYSTRHKVPLEIFFCSEKCSKRFENKRYRAGIL